MHVVMHVVVGLSLAAKMTKSEKAVFEAIELYVRILRTARH
jgi:hypothetical protein